MNRAQKIFTSQNHEWVVVNYKNEPVYKETARRLRTDAIAAFLEQHHNVENFVYHPWPYYPRMFGHKCIRRLKK